MTIKLGFQFSCCFVGGAEIITQLFISVFYVPKWRNAKIKIEGVKLFESQYSSAFNLLLLRRLDIF